MKKYELDHRQLIMGALLCNYRDSL